MHRHSFELIAEYAQGSLQDETRARSLVESCDWCRNVYEEQRAARFALESVGATVMSDLERAALHREVWTELRSPTSTPRTSETSWRRVSLAFGAAAVVVVGVGLLGVLNNQGETTRTFSEIGSGLNGGQAVDGGVSEESEPDSMTTIQPATELSDLASYKSVTREVRSADGTTTAYEGASLPPDGTSEQECLNRAGLDDYLVLERFEIQSLLIVAVPQDRDLTTTPVVFVDPDTCTILHREE